MLLFFTTITSSSTPFSVKIIIFASWSPEMRSDLGSLHTTVMYRRLNSASNQAVSFHAFIASRPRKIVAKMIRKIHMPAYWPVRTSYSGTRVAPVAHIYIMGSLPQLDCEYTQDNKNKQLSALLRPLSNTSNCNS
jgi:hypothetical protein